jgi:hypothetical protein
MTRLTDGVLAQTESIGEAILTLEETADLAAEFREASASFVELRRWLTDVTMMGPMVQRAMETLEPLTALGNLRRVSADELRQAARVVREMRETQMAQAEPQSTAAVDASPDGAEMK